MKVKTKAGEILNGLWLLSTGRMVLSLDKKVVCSYPVDDLEVDVHGEWIPFRQAWDEQKISFLAQVVSSKG